MLAKTELLKKLQLIAGSPKTEEIMVGIGKKFGLEDDRLSLVTRAIGNMLFGDLHPNFLIAHLAKVLVIQKEEARAIAHEISGQVLAQARNELAALYDIIPPDRATTPLPTAPPVISRQQAPSVGQPQSPDIARPPMPQPPPPAVSMPPARPPMPPSPVPTPSPSSFHSPVPAPSLAQNPPPPPQPAPQQSSPSQKAETPFGPQEELMRLYRMARPGTSAPTEHEPAPPPPPSQKPVSPPTAAPQRTPENEAHPPVVDLREE